MAELVTPSRELWRLWPICVFAAAAILASVGLKARYEVDYYPVEYKATQSFNIASFFLNTNFAFTQLDNGPTYLGINGACLIVVGTSHRDGNEDTAFDLRYGQSYAILYLYKGSLSKASPYFRAQLDHYVEMLRPALGLKPRVRLILHIAAGEACRSSDFAPLNVSAM